MLPDRLLQLTFCIKDAVQRNLMDEVTLLVEEREGVIEELVASGVKLDETTAYKVKVAQTAIEATLEARRQQLLTKFQSRRAGKNAVRSYHASDAYKVG